MADREPASWPRRMQISTALAQLRAGRNRAEIAGLARVSAATVTRYEDWKQVDQKLVPRTVGLIAQACGAPPAEVETLVRLAEEEAASWWVGNTAVPTWMSPFVAMEDSITAASVLEIALVPGLLQTEDYARAVHVDYAPDADQAEIDAMVEGRMRRQAVLTKRDSQKPLRLWAIIDEAVLHREIGGRDVMAEQIGHLIRQSERPNIDIQILPFSAGYSASTSFYLFGGPEDSTGAVYVEQDGGGHYFGKAPDIARYTYRFQRCRAKAASMDQSRKIMTRLSKELRA
jgi:hypothetical protein